MRAVVTVLLLLACSWCVSCGPSPQDPAAAGLRVLFLGEPASGRAAEFRAFLEARFRTVHVADRWTWERGLLQEVDVVLLDWPQQEGVSKWMLAGDRTVPPRSPLGERASWSLPTVLLGSAGLNTAWAWDVLGGFG